MKKLGLAVVGVGALTIGAIVLSITLTADQSNGGFVPSGDPITFEDYITAKFSARRFNGTWWSNDQLQWRDQDSNLVAWNIKSEETSIIVSSDTVSLVSSSANFVAFGEDKNLLLFYDNWKSVWRHSYLAEYILLKADTNEKIQIVPPGQPNGTRLQYAQWVPKSDKIVYVFQNNIYVADMASPEDEHVQITKDGVIDTIYNGIPDWVYEEEILSSNKAMYFSPGGSRMAFVQFNDTEVEEFFYTNYGDPSDPLAHQYPEQVMLKYPKVGTTNPTVKLFVNNLNQNNLPVIPPREVLDYDEHIVTAATWISEDELSVIWSNRVQNESSVSKCVQGNQEWQCTTVAQPTQANGWLDVFQPPIYSGNDYLQILPLESAGKHYPQIQHSDGHFVTGGNFVVVEILRWVNGNVYFMGTKPNEPGSRHLYVAPVEQSAAQECLTCDVVTQRGNECGYNSVSLNQNATFYVHTCLGPGIPEVVLRSTSSGQPVRFVFETNTELEEKLEGKSLSERLDLTLSMNGYSVPAMLKLPRGYSTSQKYPLLVKVYGGPGSQSIDNKWAVGFEDYLSSNYGVVTAIIDGRGTGFLSNEYMFEVYHRLGTVEIADQIAGTQQLLRQFSFLDAERTGIWGWSYGGYASAHTLVQDTNDVFKCGLSTAPVTDWLFYDSMYTERYMGLPTFEDNIEGYYVNSLLDKVEALRGKMYQLNHGVADDNVHYQQAMLLVRALELKDIEFEQHSYPDENHGLGGVRRAVYHNFDRFWSRCFGYQRITV